MEIIKPEKYRAKVSDKYFLTENQKFLYVKFELINPDRIKYRAGQYVSLKVDQSGERRSYSIASTPDDTHGFHLMAEILAEGKGSKFLQMAEIGQEVEVVAPMGQFVIREENMNKFLFVATGSGIVPVYAMINDLLINKREQRQIRLHWGLRSEEDMFWFDNLERLAEQYPNFVFDPVLSRPSETWSLCRGHVQDCLKRDFATQDGQGLSGWQGYICGNPKMVEETKAALVELKMRNEDIYYEKFA